MTDKERLTKLLTTSIGLGSDKVVILREAAELIADDLIANGVIFSAAVPGPREDNHNITELCFLNGKEAGRWEVKAKILEKLIEQRTNVKGVCHAQLVEFIKFVEGL